MKTLDLIIERGTVIGCSDIHLSFGQQPMCRINGKIGKMPFETDISEINEIMNSFAETMQNGEFQEQDLSYRTAQGVSCRLNVFMQRGKPACAIRLFQNGLPNLEGLNLPRTLEKLIHCDKGLVIVTGPTGSGKTTTLAAMISRINMIRPAHIITLEDPIEYHFDDQCALIRQREIGKDTVDFHSGIRAALREDPDVILIGEMRDYETVSAALTAAETGHLVLTTLHTAGAAQTINRMIDIFPAAQQNQIRTQLAEVFQGAVAQQLLPTIDGSSRIPACEILLGTAGIRSLIRENKAHQLNNAMLTGSKDGMITMDAALAELVRQDKITLEIAQRFAFDQKMLMQLLS